MSSSPVILVLGAGANIGTSTGKHFASKGYRVALAARSLTEKKVSDTELHLKADFADTDSIEPLFRKVIEVFGSAPNVVVFNACALTSITPAPLLYTLNAKNLTADLAANTVSAAIAAKTAVEHWSKMPASVKKTFIYTGNCMYTDVIPQYFVVGMCKTAAEHLIRAAAISYKDEGYRFYNVVQATEEGKNIHPTDGPLHAEVFAKLAESGKQEQVYYTFVKDTSFVDFGIWQL